MIPKKLRKIVTFKLGLPFIFNITLICFTLSLTIPYIFISLNEIIIRVYKTVFSIANIYSKYFHKFL